MHCTYVNVIFLKLLRLQSMFRRLWNEAFRCDMLLHRRTSCNEIVFSGEMTNNFWFDPILLFSSNHAVNLFAVPMEVCCLNIACVWLIWIMSNVFSWSTYAAAGLISKTDIFMTIYCCLQYIILCCVKVTIYDSSFRHWWQHFLAW